MGFIDLCDNVGKHEMYSRDGLHVSRKRAAVFAEGLSGAVAGGLGKVRYLNYSWAGGLSKNTIGGQNDSRYKNTEKHIRIWN